MEHSWIFSIIEVSATFVAITAGFLASKIITIASERGNVKIDIEMLDTNIAGKEGNIKALNEKINAIGFKWAEEGFGSLKNSVKELVRRLDDKPPVEIVIDLISKKENIDEYDEMLLKERFDSIWDEIVAEKEAERKAEEDYRKRRERLVKNPTLAGILGSLPDLSDAMRASTSFGEATYLNLINPARRISEREEYRSLIKEIDEEILFKKTYETQRNILMNKVSTIHLPKYMWLGLASLAFFAFGGIIVPLLVVTNIDMFIIEGVLSNKTTLIVLFIIGLVANLGYLFFEVYEAARA